jgi:hypothetical protein
MLRCFALVATRWTSWVSDFLEAVEVAIKWGMSDTELKDKAGKTSGYSVVTYQR